MDLPSRTRRPPEPVPDALVRAHKLEAIGRFVPGVIHELNNPFAAIVGFGELLRRDPRMPDDMQAHAELLVTEIARTRRIIQTILEFLRPRPPERTPTSVRALVDAVLVLHGYSLLASTIEVDLDVPADLPQVELDRPGVQLVVVDLIQDAIDSIAAAGTAGRIRVSATLDPTVGSERVTIAIEHGAPPASANPERELGHRIAASIVADHDGRLVVGAPDGGGSRVAFDLPVRARMPVVTPPLVGAAAGGGGSDDEDGGDVVASMTMPPAGAEHRSTVRATRILVLDDERPIRLLLEKWLRASGFEPVIASTGEEAVDLVREGPFDAVLCDHRMAGMNGTEVYQAVVALRPELAQRFVFMSGDVLNPQLREFVQEHGVGLLPKPFDLDTVQRTLDGVLTIG